MSAVFIVLAALALIGLGGVPAVAAAQSREQPAPEVDEKRADVILYVDGMSCPFCAYGLEKKLSRLKSVERIEIDLNEGRAVLTLKKGESVTNEALAKAVDEAGFSIRKIERPHKKAA